MRRIFVAILFIPLLAAGQPAQKGDVWLTFRYFGGAWKERGRVSPAFLSSKENISSS